MNTQDKIAIMQSHVDGAEIECSHHLNQKWSKIDDPRWAWDTCDYRIELKKSGSDTVREMLEKGKLVACGVSDQSQADADESAKAGIEVTLINLYKNEVVCGFRGIARWKYASPVDTSRIASYVSEAE